MQLKGVLVATWGTVEKGNVAFRDSSMSLMVPPEQQGLRLLTPDPVQAGLLRSCGLMGSWSLS